MSGQVTVNPLPVLPGENFTDDTVVTYTAKLVLQNLT